MLLLCMIFTLLSKSGGPLYLNKTNAAKFFRSFLAPNPIFPLKILISSPYLLSHRMERQHNEPG